MRIVGSLTTIPSRINKIKPVIDSLLKQKRPLDKLYINIPWKTLKGDTYKIPEFLTNLDGEIVCINRCQDMGPITKLIPTIEKETDDKTYIITFDDDLIVNPRVIGIFELKIKKYPNNVLSFSGWNIGSFPFYFQYCIENTHDIEVDWVQGTHGIAYPRKHLDDILNHDQTGLPGLPGLKHHDDHRISVFLENKKVKKISIGRNAFKYFYIMKHSKINAISGGISIFNQCKFHLEVAKIGWELKKRGLYFRKNDPTKSYFAKFILIVILYILFKIIKCIIP